MKILIELPSWIGDTVMMTPSMENIVNYYHNPEITLIGKNTSLEVLKNHPKVVKTQVIKKNYISLFKIAKKLGQFDVYFSFRGSARAKILRLFISSKNKYQLNMKQYPNIHQVEKYIQFLNSSLNTNFFADNLTIFQSINKKTFRPKKRLPLLGINPGASYGEAKRWYPEEFAKVAIKLSTKYDIIIFGGSNEVDIALDIEKILASKGVQNYQNYAGKTSISELISHISNLDLFVTGDSGPMHLAAGFKVPTVAIFGPTRPNETSQWMNEKSFIVYKNLGCQPCMKRKCPLSHHNCMRFIGAEDVLNAIEKL